MTRPSLTLCIIVKDEEATIGDCLASAAPIVDDIVVVDTGSTDETVDIARKFTQRTMHFPWVDDFAAARNFAMEHVRGDWILWLDADETMEVESEDAWKRSFSSKSAEADALLVTLKNYYGPSPDELKVYLYDSFRLLRTAAKLRYKQSIHEHLDLAKGPYHMDDEPVAGLRIRHYGYLDGAVQNKRKHHRNVRLLRKEQNHPHYDPWIDYHLAAEHYRQGDYTTSFACINTALRRFLKRGQLPPAIAYKVKYEILLKAGGSGNALSGVDRAIMLYPDYVDLHYYRGLFLYGDRQFPAAIEAFTTCMQLGDNGRYLQLRGAGSYMAAHMIGMCRERLGELEKARDVYEQLVETQPGFAPARERLRALLGNKEGH